VGRVRAFDLQARLLRGQRIQHADAFAVFCVHRQIVRDQLHQFRRALKGIENEDAILIRQLQPLRHHGHARALLVALRGFLLVETFGLLHRRRSIFDQIGVLTLPLVRGVPVHQVDGQLLPIAPLLREVTHPVAHDLVIAHHLVRTVFQDQPMIPSHAGNARLQGHWLRVVIRRTLRCRILA
jgi:hypothetical protein